MCTFQFRDDYESKSAINKTFCCHRLHWFKKIKNDLLFSNVEWNYNREWEKSKYLDNISVLPTSIFIFDKFVDGAQPEVADEIVGRGHILRTLNTHGECPIWFSCVYKSLCINWDNTCFNTSGFWHDKKKTYYFVLFCLKQ